MSRNTVPLPRTSSEDAAASPRVVVAVDGSASSVRALVWGLEFAESYGAVVEVVTAWPLSAPVLIGEVPGHFNDARWQAVAAQRSAVEQASALLGGAAPVVRHVVNAVPRKALADAADGAALLVLGSRRAFPTDEAVGSSLAEVLQASVRCPVLEVTALGAVSLPWGQHAFTPA